jgi:hypothetical protein
MMPLVHPLVLFVKKNGESQTQMKSSGLILTSCKYLSVCTRPLYLNDELREITPLYDIEND